MTKIEFEGKTINVPQSWDEILFGEYEKWYFQQPKTQSEHIEFIAQLCKVDEAWLMSAPPQLFESIAGSLGFMFEDSIAPSESVSIAGEKYAVSYGDKLTLGEWVDVENCFEGERENRLSEVLAILCRPVGEKYNPDNTEARSAVFRGLPCSQVLPLLAFFLHRNQSFCKISNLYSTTVTQANRFVRDIEHLVQSGGGTKRLPIWQRIKYTFLMKSLKKRLSKFSDSYSTAPTR
ncbi:hypothetical protein [Dysgonomonas sp. 25]|uniref:hypothetical protein n=1 Tax=Dysgonomonas sp. 25 TaxID=2302933 RepID=UPI0013CFF325|nr:hypothetical protein [Dysgonomonas sp. 25]NDV69199.1 hypothetical protein [Dysgonomonas sp. 25]